MISSKLKKIIFNKLYKDLSHVEIIPYKNSIWFIDRENEYWYLIYHKNGSLNWRYQFFTVFFDLFSLSQNEFDPIISEWVEEVLNYKVNTTPEQVWVSDITVEEVLNCKVNTTYLARADNMVRVEEVLNCKVNTSKGDVWVFPFAVEDVLNCKVNASTGAHTTNNRNVREVLNN